MHSIKTKQFKLVEHLLHPDSDIDAEPKICRRQSSEILPYFVQLSRLNSDLVPALNTIDPNLGMKGEGINHLEVHNLSKAGDLFLTQSQIDMSTKERRRLLVILKEDFQSFEDPVILQVQVHHAGVSILG